VATLEWLRDVFGVTVRCIAGVSVALLHSPCGIVSNGLGNLLGFKFLAEPRILAYGPGQRFGAKGMVARGAGSDLSIMRFEDFDLMLFDDQPDQARGCNLSDRLFIGSSRVLQLTTAHRLQSLEAELHVLVLVLLCCGR
jgi:hypothetical protein